MRESWRLEEIGPERDVVVRRQGAGGRSGADAPCWGDECLDVTVAGMAFRFEGLSARQCAAMAATYAGYVAVTEERPRLVTRVGRVSSAALARTRPSGLDVHPVVLARDSHRLRLAGEELRAEVPLDVDGPAWLGIATEMALADRTVSENYLRVLVAYAALAQGGVMLHSSGVVLDGRAHLFVGVSGAGKTTLARKWRAVGLPVLSDDINVAVPGTQGWRAFAVPFAGELGAQACGPALAFPLASVDLLEPGGELALARLPLQRRLAALIVSSPFVNSDGHRFGDLLDVAEALASSVVMRALRSRRHDSFADVAPLVRAAA
ncbi:MAG TPA: hypothetical protein VFS60_14825 [Thermoanaerobaculia bacterium]|nr:hypothetical protein [Thermoanaerobaculia bacterium]